MKDWSGVEEAYRVSFATLCAGTIPMVLDAVARVDGAAGPLLDVGCGTGELAAEALRRGYQVTALDPDPAMVAMTRDQLGEHVPVRLDVAALPDLPYPDGAYGAVCANFVINHVGDPRAGVRELARVAAPGARLAMTIWPAAGAGWNPLVGAAFSEAGVVPVPSTRLPAHLDFARTPEGLAALATEAGLEVVSAQEVCWTWSVSPEDLWTGVAGGVATVGQTLLAQAAQVQQAAADVYRERAAQEVAPDGLLHLPSRAVLVLAARS